MASDGGRERNDMKAMAEGQWRPPAVAVMVAGEAAGTKVPGERSLPEVHGSIAIPRGHARWAAVRKFLAYAGPGFLVAVGYMDPGNWATSLAAGSAYGYALLSVVLISSLMAMFLQALCARLGIATGLDLAQACRVRYLRRTSFLLWVLAELAIAATDLAEVVGTAIALNLLFGLPLLLGVILTALDVILILFLQHRGFRYVEALVVSLIAIIMGSFFLNLLYASPALGPIVAGLIPTGRLVLEPEMLYLALGILGATVMPHNLYLHSSIVQTRAYGSDERDKREAIRYATADSTIALGIAFFVNAAILVLSAATFHTRGFTQVAEIQEAYRLLSPLLGVQAASLLFAVALLAAGQNSTLTGTLAGQVVMEGFLRLRLPAWLRRLITRLVAIVPAVLVTALAGPSATAQLLILSQVILSLQLPFAVIPLMQFTGDPRLMGPFVNTGWMKVLGWAIALTITGLNAFLLYQTVAGLLGGSGAPMAG